MDTKIKIPRKHILIIHPEGNIFNNPNLYSMIKLLSKTYLVDILIPKLAINSELSFSEKQIKILQYDKVFTEQVLCSNSLFIELFVERYTSNIYSFIIGVDRLGLILSHLISKIYGVKYAYISYEIFFENETSATYKNLEILASKDTCFTVVQDTVRAEHLSKENAICLDKMLLIPVASSHTNCFHKNYYLHDKFKLDRNTKILLFIGSISSWTCIKSILDIAGKIPNDWVIVFHDRYGNTKNKLENFFFGDISHLTNIYFSDIKIAKIEQMNRLIHSADIGLSLYCPDYKSKYTGKNLAYIGMASGKISTFLQNGLPIITTKNEVLSDAIKKYQIGYEINQPRDIIPILNRYKPYTMNDNCIKFFNNVLSFDNYKDNFLLKIKDNLKLSDSTKVTAAKDDRLELYKTITQANKMSIKNKTKLAFSERFNQFYGLIQLLKEKDLRYVVYGNGCLGKTIHSLLKESVVAFVDIKSVLVTDNIQKMEVYSPNNLKNMEYDKIIVSVLGRENDILNFLVVKLGIDRENLITLNL